MDKTWKKFERWIAQQWGVKRRPGSGAAGFSRGEGTDDVIHPMLYIEAKNVSGSRVPGRGLWKQTRNRAKKEQKIPIVVVHEKRTPYEESWVWVRPQDLLRVAILYGLGQDSLARQQMEENEKAPPTGRWKLTFAEMFVRDLSMIRDQMQDLVPDDITNQAMLARQRMVGAQQAKIKLDDYLSGDPERMKKTLKDDTFGILTCKECGTKFRGVDEDLCDACRGDNYD